MRTVTLKNRGSTCDKVSNTQKQRKLKELRTNAQKALWFLESFGFKLSNITLTDLNHKKTNIHYENKTKVCYNFLNEADKDTIKNVVFIMDQFCVSDAAYHEFSMIDKEGLPHSYLIKQCRQDLNRLWSILRTSGECPGAQLNFREELHHQLSKQVNSIN